MKRLLLKASAPVVLVVSLGLSISVSDATEVTPTLKPVTEKGVFRTYRIQYSDENTTTIFPKRLGHDKGGASTFMSTLSFDGDLRVKDYGDVDGKPLYSLSFDDVRSRHFALNGHDVFSDKTSFMDTHKRQEIYVSMNKNNEIERFYYPSGTTQVFKTFMTTVAQEIQVSAREGADRWVSHETNQHGKGRVTYEVTGKHGDRITLKKTRDGYEYPGLIENDDRQTVRVDDTVTLNTRGFIEEIEKREETTITSKDERQTILEVRKTLRLRLKGRGEFDPTGLGPDDLSAMQSTVPGEPVSDREQNRELLAKQASYISYDEIENWIRGFKPNPKDNHANNAMFYRATGFVELHPKSAEKLADYCTTKASTSQERVLIMNILAAVGNANAQAAMRKILTEKRLMQDRRQYGIMVQNFSFVDQKPEPETLTFLQQLMNEHTGYISYSSAHAYGAAIHKLYQGEPEEKKEALSLNRELLKKIDHAGTDDEKAEYVAALGNAGMVENNEVLFRFSTSGEPRLRAEAVMALRKTETPTSRNHVVSVFDDTDRAVQRSAIQTFLHFTPEEKQLRDIKAKLDLETIQEANFYDMVTLLSKHRSAYPALVNECFRLMVRKKLHDPDPEARIRSLMK